MTKDISIILRQLAKRQGEDYIWRAAKEAADEIDDLRSQIAHLKRKTSRMTRPMLTIGFHKGDVDYELHADINNLTLEEMQKFRMMIPVAIGETEETWKRSEMARPENMACASEPDDPKPIHPTLKGLLDEMRGGDTSQPWDD